MFWALSSVTVEIYANRHPRGDTPLAEFYLKHRLKHRISEDLDFFSEQEVHCTTSDVVHIKGILTSKTGKSEILFPRL